MGEQRQRYSDEFKQQTVKFIQEQTKSITDIAEELNIPVKTLRNWLAKYRQFESESIASPDRVRELEQLLKEKEREIAEKDRKIANMEEEIAIVKKAVHIFSKPRN